MGVSGKKGWNGTNCTTNTKNSENSTGYRGKIWVSVSKVVMPVLHGMKEHKELLVNETQRLFTAVPKKVALKVAVLRRPRLTIR